MGKFKSIDTSMLSALAEPNHRYYKLRPEPFQVIEYWATSFQKHMEKRLDNLDDYVQELKNKRKRDE
jgi:hypothetical protein